MYSSAASFVLLIIFARCTLNESFAPTTAHVSTPKRETKLHFFIPTFGQEKDEETDDSSKAADEKEEKKIGLSGLVQLITAGMGSPFLGNFEGVEEETGKMMFSLEANNLVDEDGNSKQTSMPYFESGWVDEKDLEKERMKKAGKKSGGFKLW